MVKQRLSCQWCAGNINQLVLKVESYAKALEKTKVGSWHFDRSVWHVLPVCANSHTRRSLLDIENNLRSSLFGQLLLLYSLKASPTLRKALPPACLDFYTDAVGVLNHFASSGPTVALYAKIGSELMLHFATLGEQSS